MNISEFIPEGKENAISRKRLCEITGLSDRRMRIELQQARRTCVILYKSGGGYYKPTTHELLELKQYIKQENSRAISIFKSIKTAKALSDDIEHGRVV